MRKRILSVILSCSLVIPTIFSLSGCGTEKVQAMDLMSGVVPNTVSADIDITGESAVKVTDFAVRLFRESAEEGKNALISPLSVICALGMTANGAAGNTLAQMEETFGSPVAELNEYLYSYFDTLGVSGNDSGENFNSKSKLSVANSLWVKDDESFDVEQSFLQTSADWYRASMYKVPFNDEALKDINAWVNNNTDGMIKDILNEISEDAVMYLVNALAFDAEWQNIYEKNQVLDGIFTKEDGTQQNVKMMHSSERRYIEDENAAGFIKYYSGGKYAFAALLPNENVKLADYVNALTGEKLHGILSDARNVQVNAAMPKFKTEYSIEMSEAFKAMGVTDAFDWNLADFSGIGSVIDGNLCISRILHKTFIAVDEKGTKAGAATVVEMIANSAAPSEDVKTVRLDRPFVYMLIDSEANIPLFIGTAYGIK